MRAKNEKLLIEARGRGFRVIPDGQGIAGCLGEWGERKIFKLLTGFRVETDGVR